MRDPRELVTVELTDEERVLVQTALNEWGGPASCTDALAVAMGFDGVADLTVQRRRLMVSLAEREPLSRWDWTRVLFATEIVFASDVVGSGVEWPTTSGLDDDVTIEVLRHLQRSLGGVRVPIGRAGARSNSPPAPNPHP